MKIFAVAGSERMKSYNGQLRDLAAKRLTEMGCEVTGFDFGVNPLPLMSENLEAEGYPPNVLAFKRAVAEADGILLVCPEYNSSITPLTKNFIDWASRGKHGEKNEWRGKPVLLMSASPGMYGGVRGLYPVRGVMVEVQALVLSEQACISAVHKAFDETGEIIDERTRGFFEASLARLLDVTAKLK
jgi:NAD(P)H-dependent FMN reductase